MPASASSSAGLIVIETPARAGILLHLLDDLAAVLDLAAQASTPSGGRSRAYAAELAKEVRCVRAELREPENDAPNMAYGAREWRQGLCADLDQVPLQQAGLDLLRREMRAESGPQ
jgi:hypothetical protein